MGNNNYSKIGEDIKVIVQNALESQEFKDLNRNITETVNRAMDEVKRSGQYWQEQQKQYSRPARNKLDEKIARKQQKIQRRQEKIMVKNNYPANAVAQKKAVPPLIAKSPYGRVSGVLLTVFGDVSIGLSLLLFLIFSVVSGFAYASLPFWGISAGITVPIFLIGLVMAIKGSGLRGRVRRFRQYASRLKDRNFCQIKELSDFSGRSKKYIVKDLKTMIRLGMFPQGRIDEEETYLLISDEAYENHLKMKEGKRLQDERSRVDQESLAQKRKLEAANPELKAVNEVIAEGQNVIRQINEANEAIPGEVISQKLDRLETVITKIFQFIEENPEGLPEIRKFMDYYLPTTLKLVSVYRDLDAEPIQGANIMATKKEIEETLDTISHAFENLLDSFYEDTAMDVSTDISVLNTMLAQEGLTQRDFKKQP